MLRDKINGVMPLSVEGVAKENPEIIQPQQGQGLNPEQWIGRYLTASAKSTDSKTHGKGSPMLHISKVFIKLKKDPFLVLPFRGFR